MNNQHVFEPKKDAEKLALEIVAFLRKWGMWEDVQIFTGGKCYADNHGELIIRKEEHPEKYTEGFGGRDCNGNSVWEDYSNPQRLLDMTFEGALSLLLRHHEYEVKIADVSEEVKHLIITEKHEDLVDDTDILVDYLDGKYDWDPAEFDSYEEWLELNQYCDMDLCHADSQVAKVYGTDFTSREEYEDFLLRSASERDYRIFDYMDDIEEETQFTTSFERETFYDKGSIANRVLNEFGSLLEKYGLWYDLGYSWSLTTYRI